LGTPKTAVFDANGAQSELNIGQITGLSASDFERLVLLAQGRWTSFLYARESEKAALLENLTDTEIYRRISQRVYERCDGEERFLKDLQAQLTNLKSRLLSQEEQVELEQKHRDNNLQMLGIKGQLNDINYSINVAGQAEELKRELEMIDCRLKALAEEENSFKPNRLK
jgi:exonuclease SbcC